MIEKTSQPKTSDMAPEGVVKGDGQEGNKPKPLRQRVTVPIPPDWPHEFRDPRTAVEQRADYRAGRMYLMEKLIVWAMVLALLLTYLLS